MANHPFSGRYPTTRLRRLRQAPWIRDLVAEHRLGVADLIWPIFVSEGPESRVPVASLPGVDRLSVDALPAAVAEAAELGIRAVAPFPATPPALKTPDGAEATNPDNLICRAIRTIKGSAPDLGVIVDVALDPYTDHGHDGLLDQGVIVNDRTVAVLAAQAVNQARAGADMLAPSDMMDGRVGAIRQALDTAGFQDVGILSYAAKYASVFFGPFREAVGSLTKLQGDKKTYQMDPANTDEAIREVALDIAEGADMVMVKPGLPYLDIVRRVKTELSVPTFAYHVSGEYAMLKAADAQGWLPYDRALMEVLVGFKRAGCDGVLTYGALDAARLLRDALG